MLNTNQKQLVALRIAKKATKTLKILGKPAVQKQRFLAVGSSVPEIHKVEPARLPADFCEVKKKQYTQLKPGKTGFKVPKEQLGTLVVAKVAKGIFDAITCAQLLCSNAYNMHELKLAKRAYHATRRFISSRDDILGTSTFVRQSMKVLSITLRFATKRCHRHQDDRFAVITEASGMTRFQPISLGVLD